MSGCFIPETQKGLRIITTYLFSPLQYAILLIFSGNSKEVERKSKRATVQAHSGINNYSSIPWFCHWFCLSIEFSCLISFALNWKTRMQRISDNRKQIYLIYKNGKEISGLSSNLRAQHIIISLLLHKSDQLTAALSLHVWMHVGNEMWRHSTLWACKHTTFLSKLLHTNISSLKAAFILSVSSSCINRHNLQ